MHRFFSSLSVLLVVCVAGTLAVETGEARAQTPASLEQCYLKAIDKSSPDLIHATRTLCDDIFRPGPRVVAVLHKKTCSEWWFDEHGRFESRERYCSMERAAERRWTLACQYKAPANKVTLVELEEVGDRYARVGELRGIDIGEVFKSLAGCVRQKLGPAKK